MQKVLVGSVSPEGERLLQAYIDAFIPDAVVEPLKSVGIKGKMKNHASKADVILVIIDETLYQSCVGFVDDVLAMSKVHKYINDDGLKQFLISKFGMLDGSGGSCIPPDQLMASNFLKGSKEDTLAPDMVYSVGDEEDLSISASVDESVELEDLRAKLATSEMLVRNLQSRLEDKNAGADDDLAAMVERIKELERQLEDERNKDTEDLIALGKVAKAESLLAEHDKLKGQLRESNEAKSQLEFERSKLATSVKDLEAEVAQLKTRIEEVDSLKADISAKRSEVTESKVRISELQEELETKNAELMRIQADIGVLQAEVEKSGGTDERIKALESELEQERIKCSDLTADLEIKSSSLKSAEEDLQKVRDKLARKEEESKSLGTDAEGLRGTIDELRSSIDSLNSKIASLEKAIDDKDAELVKYCQNEIHLKEQIDALTADSESLESKYSEINMLNETLEENKTLISNLSNNLKDAKLKISDYESKVKELEQKVLFATDEVEVNKQAYDKALDSQRITAEKLSEEEKRVSDLRSELDDVKAQLLKKKEEFNILSEAKIKADADVRRLEIRVKSLESDVIDSKANEEMIERLETEILEERRKVARLNSEVEVLKKSDDSLKATNLRVEIARLQQELEDAKSEGNKEATVEIDSLKQELIDTRSRCASLELDLVDRDEQLRELNTGVFARMANLSTAKAMYDVSLPPITCDTSRFWCVAGGSAESSFSVYQTLSKACAAEPNKHFIVIDITTDSSIDQAFGVQKVTSPVSWLSGAEDFKGFVANTKYNNVKVLSTALAYLNDLFLLGVDWDARFRELGAVADVYIINIGCLNSTTSKALFNTFSQYMKTFVIAKATPINLRTTILNLTGVKGLSSNVTTVCVNFDDKASRDMYTRLSAKFKSQIIPSTGVLKFE